MRFLFILCFLTACSAAPFAADRHVAFVAKHATEATLTFSHHVEIISATEPSALQAEEQIKAQVQHLFGPMERAEVMAAPKEDQQITNVQITQKDASTWKIGYSYQGTIVVEKGPRKYYDVMLPNDPSTIYQTAMVGSRNPCTDEHYQEEGDFWYFWSPAPTYPKCRLKLGRDYQVVRGEIERVNPAARSTYPEYHRLVKNGQIRADVFFGLDDAEHNHNPARSKDYGAQGFRALKKNLEESGFSFVEMSEGEKRRIAVAGALPHVEVGTKEARGLRLTVNLFFGETGIDEDSTAFHHFFRDALKNASVMIYDGHSGLGGHLDLAAIAEAENFQIMLPKNQYQIFFFNSCTSYTYYNALYFQKKRGAGPTPVDPKGTKNLDILANGLGTDFDLQQKVNFALLAAIDAWAMHGHWTSYQNLAKRIDDDNLFTVNGDEDNPIRPGTSR